MIYLWFSRKASSHQAEDESKLNYTSPLCTLKSSALRTPEDKENQIAHHLEGPEASIHQTRDWSKLSTSLLRTPKSSDLRTAEVKTDCSKKRGAICTKIEKWVESERSLEDSKEKCLLDEFEVKETAIDTRKKLEIMQLEYEERKKREYEVHNINMEMLNMEKQYLLNKYKI
ncbi:unnamed protein product [Acanthoscelides obtectus]|uniref:No apical meristem-associated C-terminal domain-containing protein n=1 Tax=Acanthoscelides obtectus TaxID=200917 RepID=A0A9P0LX17_ACAOB|nr:unnamed protein product [Acanthoscelides obtectus]CAK1685995.1 hypothetical protein AOBTE_LOCUS35746 [Acanthoscelides obtectus]